MAKKGGGSQFQADIQTDEDLEIFTDQSKLCDVYTEWCGPCLGMVSTLKKLKSDFGDTIQLAICKSDTIEALARFRNKSEPTWLLVTNGRLFNIVFGTDIPNFKLLIAAEMKRLKKIPESELVPIRELLPIEKQRFDRIQGVAATIRAAKENKANRERRQYLNYVQDKILSYTSGGFGVTLFGPQVTRNHLQAILKMAEGEGLSCQDRHHVILLPSHIDTLHFQCKNPIPDEVLEQLYNKELLVCFWKSRDLKKRKIEDVLNEFVNKLTKLPVAIEGQPSLGPILEPLDIKIKRVKSETEIPEPEPEIELNYRMSDNNGEDDEDEMEGENSEAPVSSESLILTKKSSSFLYKITVPAAWTPINAKGTASAIYVFFRNQTTAFLPPDPVPEPPHLIMAFDAWKRRDVTDVMNKYTEDILGYGYFTTEEPETATLLAKTTKIYEKSARNRNDKLILKVAKKTSHTVLAFAAHGPTYVSPNIDTGKAEAMFFFPENYNKVTEDEPIPLEPIQEPKPKEPAKTAPAGKEEVKAKGVPAKTAGKDESKAKEMSAATENVKGSRTSKRTSRGSGRGSRSSKKRTSTGKRNSRPSRAPPPT